MSGPACVHAIVLAGGTGQRLGGMAKSELRLGGCRLLDLVLSGIDPLVTGELVVVAPGPVAVPQGVARTMEQPAGGGPLAGIGAGVSKLGPSNDDLVLVTAVDTPAAGELAVLLVGAADEDPGRDGALVLGEEPQPFRQYLQAIYRAGALGQALRAAGTLHDRAVRRALGNLDLVEVPVAAELCRDLDTVEDLRWWDGRVSASRSAGRRPGRAGG